MGSGGLGSTSLSVLFSFCELHYNRDACQGLSGKLERLLNSFFAFEFNVTDSVKLFVSS